MRLAIFFNEGIRVSEVADHPGARIRTSGGLACRLRHWFVVAMLFSDSGVFVIGRSFPSACTRRDFRSKELNVPNPCPHFIPMAANCPQGAKHDADGDLVLRRQVTVKPYSGECIAEWTKKFSLRGPVCHCKDNVRKHTRKAVFKRSTEISGGSRRDRNRTRHIPRRQGPMRCDRRLARFSRPCRSFFRANLPQPAGPVAVHKAPRW